jgi:hypothetical protein
LKTGSAREEELVDDMLTSEDCVGLVRNSNGRPAVGVSNAAANNATLGGDARFDVLAK